MGKKRIHELAKELSMSSTDLLQKITEWKLFPGLKLGPQNGLDESMVTEIQNRLSGQTDAGKVQVVRRRKKVESADIDENDDQPGRAEDEPGEPDTSAQDGKIAAAPAEETPVKPVDKAAEPVKIKPKKFETATIIAPPKAPEKQAQPVPDFIRRSVAEPVKPAAPAPEPVKAEKQPEPKVEVKEIKEQPPVQTPPPAGSQPRVEAKPEKVTAQPSTKFESAKVVGTKTSWREDRPEPGGHQPYRHQPGGGQRPNYSDRPAGSGPYNPRPGARPERPQGQPGSEPRGVERKDGDSPNWAPKKPGFNKPAGGFTPGRKPAAPETTIIMPDQDAARKRADRRKKSHGGYADGGGVDESQAGKAGKRRDLVERTDLYPDGVWEKGRKKNKGQKKVQAKTEITVPKASKRRIKVDEAITVSELAHKLSIKAGDIIKKLMTMGVLAGQNQSLDYDTATLVAAEFDYEVEKSSFDETGIMALNPGRKVDESELSTRPPVVTIMGHVDHGKTSLLDYIRKTAVQSEEAGGITQHIGAYHVNAGGRKITFLDTPGHEAFTAMRSRGAQVTDIVILIVAADDGVMPQTKEAADHAKAAGVPIIVAINKIDKPQADAERIRRQMMEIGLVQEAWGGDTVFVELSAKSGQGVDELLDMILLQADILDMKAKLDGPARGRIIEARLDKGRGPVATVLVQEGTLKQGDAYVCGVFSGKVRALFDDQGQRVTQAGPAIPVEIQGISGVPQAGDEFIGLEDEKQARQVSQHRLLKQRESELTKSSKLTLETLFDSIKAGSVKGLNLILKTDVQGSLEAIADSVMKLSTPELKIHVIHQSTGAISETDIMLASASNALIIGFGVRPPAKVQELADAERVQVRFYDIIYKLLDDLKEAMAGLLDPVKSEKVLGEAEVRAVFAVSKVGTIAGCYVTDGKIIRGSSARLIRDGVVIYQGRLSSLKRLKDDAKEVNSGYECGIGFENYNDIKVGDVIEAFQVEEKAATVALIDEALERAGKAAKEKEAADRRREKEAALEAENN